MATRTGGGRQGGKKKVKAGKLMKSKQIAKAVRNTRKKGKKQLNPDLNALLKPSEDDVLKLLAGQVHIARKNAHVNMKRYIWKRRADGIHIFNLEKTWAKLVLAARIIVTVKDPSEIMVMSARTYGQRGAIKFAKHTGATAHAGKWVPGTLTNPQNKAYVEPRLIIVDDPMTNFAALRETSYIGIPVVAFCNSDNNLRFVDCAIPCNNKGRYSIGLMFWFLAREVLRMRGKLSRSADWFKENPSACPDLFFYRDPNEIAKAKKDREERERQQQEANNQGIGGIGQDTGYEYNYQDVGTGQQMGGLDDYGVTGGNQDYVDQSWQVEPAAQPLADWGDDAQQNYGGGGAAAAAAADIGGGFDNQQQQQFDNNQPQQQDYNYNYNQQQQQQQGGFQDW